MILSVFSRSAKRRLAAACAVLVIILIGIAVTYSRFSPQSDSVPSTVPAAEETAKVVKVVDGDTIDIERNGETERVRLLLVDTPETVDPNRGVQPFGPEASSFTKETLTGKEVRLEKDVSERDKFGRLLFYVYLGDRMFNEMLLEKGLARVAVYPPDVKYVDRFRTIQKKARQAGLGIWSLENYAKDDGYHPESAKAKKPAATAAAPKPKASGGVYYASCAEAAKAGVYNIKRSDPGYQSELDSDLDGVACERN